MEKKMQEYEEFIKAETGKKLSASERANLQAYHREMIANFQHERLIHLIVTLFFSFVTIIMLLLTGWMTAVSGFDVALIPLYALVLLLVILSGCYVKHYYFLENHTQGLYKYSEELYKK